MTLVAIEEHWTLPDLAAALADLPPDVRDDSLALNDRGDTRQRLEDLGEGRIAAMEAQGISVSLLALTPPATQPLPAEQAVRLSCAANDAATAAVDRHPTRFRALSTLPMSCPHAVAAELERAAGLGHVGTMVHGRSEDLLLDDPVYDDFLAAAEDLGQPVFLHPQLPPSAVRDFSYRGFNPTTDLALATYGWGWHVDTGLAALRLILRGTFDRHPRLQIVLGHWGQMLLFWLNRANSTARAAGLPKPVSEYMRSNFFITTSGMLDPVMLRHALSVTSADRLIFSTDYPFQAPTREEIDGFLACFPTDVERRQFSSLNATSLYRLDV